MTAPSPDPPAAWSHPALDKATDAAEGFRRIAAARLVHLLAHKQPALDGEMEGVHQMRVALRQLRAALVLFAPLLDPSPAARFEAELKRLGRVLGEARDWDVFCEETLPKAFPGPAGEWRRLLDDAAGRERRAAHGRLARELSRPALAELAAGLTAWAEAGAMSSGKHADRRLHREAPGLLGRLARRVVKRGRNIAERSPEELHALRKSLKKLRYGVEDLAPLFPRKAVKSYRTGLKELQEILGSLNDGVAAASLAGQIGTADAPRLHDAASALARWAELQRTAGTGHLAEAWAEFGEARPFWR